MSANKLARGSFYLWLLLWPWQTKIILRAAASPYEEISLFLSFGFLLWPLFVWGKDLFLTKRKKWLTDKRFKPSWTIGLALVAGMAVMSLAWAPDKLLVLYRLLFLLFGLLLFWAVRQDKFINRQTALNFFIAGLIIPACLGIGQFYWQQAPATKYLGLASHAAGVLGDSVVATATVRYLRAYGSFDHPNIFGGVMVWGLIAVLYAFFNRTNRGQKKTFYIAAGVIFFAALFFSFSRAAYVAGAISFPLILWTFWRRRGPERKKAVAAAFVFLSMALILAIAYRPLLSVRTQTDTRLENKSLTERALYLQQARQIIATDGAFGVGLGNYIPVLERVFPGQPSWYYQPVHNYWLLIWSELGFVGLIGMIVLWIGIGYRSWFKKTYPVLLALLILSFFDHWLWTQPAVLVNCWLLLGWLI